MAVTDPDPRLLAALSGFPEPWQTWAGGEYPSRPSVFPPLRGWMCSGCGRGWAPSMTMCGYCGPEKVTAAASADLDMSDEDYER